MIDLTPLDVRKKKEDFRRAVRGYDSGQVDSFLDLVADRFEELVREQRSLSERVKSLQEQLSRYQERERALNDALLAAQELREEARTQADRDSAVRLREAESHAEAILLEADQAVRAAQRRLKELRARRVQFLRSCRAVLHRFSETLELEEARLESEPYDFGDLLEKLQAEPPEGEVGPAPDRATPNSDRAPSAEQANPNPSPDRSQSSSAEPSDPASSDSAPSAEPSDRASSAEPSDPAPSGSSAGMPSRSEGEGS